MKETDDRYMPIGKCVMMRVPVGLAHVVTAMIERKYIEPARRLRGRREQLVRRAEVVDDEIEWV